LEKASPSPLLIATSPFLKGMTLTRGKENFLEKVFLTPKKQLYQPRPMINMAAMPRRKPMI